MPDSHVLLQAILVVYGMIAVFVFALLAVAVLFFEPPTSRVDDGWVVFALCSLGLPFGLMLLGTLLGPEEETPLALPAVFFLFVGSPNSPPFIASVSSAFKGVLFFGVPAGFLFAIVATKNPIGRARVAGALGGAVLFLQNLKKCPEERERASRALILGILGVTGVFLIASILYYLAPWSQIHPHWISSANPIVFSEPGTLNVELQQSWAQIHYPRCYWPDRQDTTRVRPVEINQVTLHFHLDPSDRTSHPWLEFQWPNGERRAAVGYSSIERFPPGKPEWVRGQGPLKLTVTCPEHSQCCWVR